MTFFGNEKPTPYSILSENRVAESLLDLNKIDQNKTICLDGYHENICTLLNKYLDIDCSDRILLVENEDTNGTSNVLNTWPKIFDKKFCLVHPIHYVRLNSNNLKNLIYFEMDISNTQQTAKRIVNPIKYDKIIVKNCLKYFELNYRDLLKYILTLFNPNSINNENSLLIIQRVADLNTLPFYNSLKKEWLHNDAKYSSFISELQKEYFSIDWDIEVVKSYIKSKSIWYKYITHRQTYPLASENSIIKDECLNGKELVHGIRELDEGLFKYEMSEAPIELNDRLLFIGAHLKPFEKSQIIEKKTQDFTNRHKMLSFKKQNELLEEISQLRMQITPDLRNILSINKSTEMFN